METTHFISQFVSGRFEKQLNYHSFYPTLINASWHIDSPDLQMLLSEADRKLGELNAFAQLIPDIDFFIRMHIIKEATTSSQIEGTQTNMEEALIAEEDIQQEKRDDWHEVQNYVRAMNFSISYLEKLPLSSRLIRETHKILLDGVRGKNKMPGDFRKSQNWIGATLKDATFIPPHCSRIDELMSDLEKFAHNETVNVPHLVKIGIIHYQFETIHPFLDGNGRMGRLLIILYLVSNGLLKYPALYLSDFFEKNRSYYYDNLHRVRTHNDLVQWLKFYLAGVIETSESAINTFKAIIQLRDRVEHQIIPTLGNKTKVEKAFKLINMLYKNPIVTINGMTQEIGIETTTANRLVKDFMDAEILFAMKEAKRNRMFVFSEYLNLFQHS